MLLLCSVLLLWMRIARVSSTKYVRVLSVCFDPRPLHSGMLAAFSMYLDLAVRFGQTFFPLC